MSGGRGTTVEEGRALLLAGRLEEASIVAEALMRSLPDDVGTLVFTGDVALAAGDAASARMLFESALRRDGEHEPTLERLRALGGAFPRRPLRYDEICRTRDFLFQTLTVRNVPRRKPFFLERLAGKRVLHVGCVDYPVFKPETNLHLALEGRVAELHGCDTAAPEEVLPLQRLVKGPIFSSLDAVLQWGERYDVVILPEVLEHIPNPRAFLEELFRIPSDEFLITVPHYKHYVQSRYERETFEEFVHPDHKCYFSPYTLLNTVLPFIDRARDGLELFVMENQTAVGLWIDRRGR